MVRSEPWQPGGPAVPWGASGPALLAGRGKGLPRGQPPCSAQAGPPQEVASSQTLYTYLRIQQTYI